MLFQTPLRTAGGEFRGVICLFTLTKSSLDVLSEIEGNLKTIDRLVKEITALDKLFGKDARPQIRQDQRKVETIQVLFEDRIRGLNPDRRTESFSMLHKGCQAFEDLDWFWTKIPRPPGMSRISDRSNRFDGVLISPAHVEKARVALQLFSEAWLLVNPDPIDRPSLDIIQYMPAIACVLYAHGKQNLFNKFIAAEIRDSAFNEDAFHERVVEALGSQWEAKEIVAQFSRVRQRPWHEGDNLTLEWSEPLPLIRKRVLGHRQGLDVYEVQDAWDPSRSYALKVVNTETADNKQRHDLGNEIRQLLKIGQEDHRHHIVKCTKSYVRGPRREEVGMLLTPVASHDLNSLLLRCCQDHTFRRQHKSEIIGACGCLSYSLAYLHNVQKMRHRDVKPHNILYHQPQGKGPAEFLWADFGLAFVFREQGFSGDPNPNFFATPEYEAPEIDYTKSSIHTRASDIYALGCVFLEIVCVLSMMGEKTRDRIQLRADYWANNQYYKHHLVGLKSWIAQMDTKLKKRNEKTLRKILQLAQKMVEKNPSDRPKIGDIVLEMSKFKVMEASEQLFCARCTEMIRIDTGKHPKHIDIFRHQSGHQ
jgi:serine/threonine protein kinase